LVYLKTNPLQENHAASFGMTQSQENLLIHLLSGLLRKALKQLGELPDRNEFRVMYIIKLFKFFIPGAGGTRDWWCKKMSYYQRLFQMSQVGF
jgi:hypothetical protein